MSLKAQIDINTYLDQELKTELLETQARFEVARIKRKVQMSKIAADIERHLKLKFSNKIVGS